MFSLHGKVALLVGHEGNLGPIWEETLEGAGAKVVGMGLPDEDFTDTNYIWLQTAAWKTPDIIICNAAIDTPPSTIDARFFTNFEQTMQVNLTGHARTIEFFLPRMIQNGGGVIVFIGSIMGWRAADWTNYEGGFEKPVAYNLSKAAFVHLARCLTRQYGHKGIRAVCPSFGPVMTEKLDGKFLDRITSKIPMRRVVSIKSLKQTLLYACCCQELAGASWLIDGGYLT